MEARFKIELGTEVGDKITGYTGMVTARTEYIGNVYRYAVEPYSEKGKPMQTEWFDEARLSVVRHETDLPKC